MITTSSEEIINYLKGKGHKLNDEEKNFIRSKVLEIMKDSYDYGQAEERESNRVEPECDCGLDRTLNMVTINLK